VALEREIIAKPQQAEAMKPMCWESSVEKFP